MNCTCCGANLHEQEKECRYCGEPSIQHGARVERPVVHVDVHQHYSESDASHTRAKHIYVEHHTRHKSERNRLTLLLLCIFLGRYGVHKFYQGKPGMGLLHLATHGLFYIGWIYDIIDIAIGNPVDGEGYPILW
ncbi:MAG: TM2 domain-containing protein [Clostridia bacterium]|nr:TM2 domain-containing protein [Clostridia bacterium]